MEEVLEVDGSRFGFGGQEKDDEIYGAGGAYTAEYWEYDARLGRRWNIDPMVYAWQSGYAVFNNNPLYFVDPYGLEGEKPGDKRTTIEGCEEVMNNDNRWQDDATKLGTFEFSIKADPACWLPPNMDLAATHREIYNEVMEHLKNSGFQTSLGGTPDAFRRHMWSATFSALIYSLKEQYVMKQTGWVIHLPLIGGVKAGSAYKEVGLETEAAFSYMSGALDLAIMGGVYKLITNATRKALNRAVTREIVEHTAAKGRLPANVFSSKAPVQVTPGVTKLSGQYIDDLGRVQPWKATYDKFEGLLKERTGMQPIKRMVLMQFTIIVISICLKHK